MICAGVPPHGVAGVDPFPRQSATAPVTCGVAMLVPETSKVSPNGNVDVMKTPGAAIVCAISVCLVAKLEKLAKVSSCSPRSGKSRVHSIEVPAAPGCPSQSDIAVTVRTSG